MTVTGDPRVIAEFWDQARGSLDDAPEEVPEAWAFGATVAHADELLALVRDGIKTGTASSIWDYEDTGDPLPEVGEYSIILDGDGTPQVIIRTTVLDVVPFDEVGEEHARSEGEDDRTLASWRRIHEWYWTNHSESPRGFAPDMPVLCERFELVFPRA